MTINFLKPTKTNHITNKEYWRKKLLEKISPIWKKIIYGLSWLGIVLLGSLIGAKIFLSSQILWLKEIEIILFLFILVDFVIINGVFSKRGLKNEKFWFWFLVSLLFLNFVWSLGTSEYAQQGIYDFKIGINYLVIIPGLLLLKTNRERINKLFIYSKEISLDQKADSQRKSRKWIYRSILILIIILSFVMRIQNLHSINGFYLEDEFNHLASATELLQSGELSYTRAQLLTVVIAILFKFFGLSILVARIPGIIFGVLTTLTIYLLGKKINKIVGLIAAYLWAVSPTAILLSQYTREYSLNLFLLTLFILSLFWILKDLNKIKLNFVSVTKIFIFFIPFIYYYFDRNSTFQLVLFTYIITAVLLFLLYKSKAFFISKRSKILSTIFIFVLVLLVYKVLSSNIAHISFFSSNFEYWYYFFGPSHPFHWFYGLNIDRAIIILFFFFPILLLKRNKIYIIFITAFLLVLQYFIYFFSGGFTPRFVYYIMFFYMILLSTSIYYIFQLRSLFHRRKLATTILILFFMVMFNPINTIKITNNIENGVKNPTLWIEYRKTDEIEKAANFLRDYTENEKFSLITENPSVYFFYYASPKRNNYLNKIYVIYRFRYQLPSNQYAAILNTIKNKNVIYINPSDVIKNSDKLTLNLIYYNQSFKIYKTQLR